MVEEATAASRNLAGEADRMAALVSRFELGRMAQPSEAQMRYAA
jgi:methyl-accepting chemotaxis protein